MTAYTSELGGRLGLSDSAPARQKHLQRADTGLAFAFPNVIHQPHLTMDCVFQLRIQSNGVQLPLALTLQHCPFILSPSRGGEALQ